MPKPNILHVVNISFVLPYFIGDQFDFFNAKGIQFYVACSPSAHLTDYSKEKQFIPLPLNVLRSINPVADLKSIIKLIRQIKLHQIDTVIGHTPKGAMIAMVAAYFAGTKKRIYFRHGIMYETSTGIKRFLLKSIEKLTARLATKIVCVSESVKQRSLAENLNRADKMLLLNKGTCNGLDYNKFSRSNINFETTNALRIKYNISETDRVIGYVGRLVNDKGINELLAAWRILTSKYSDIKLLLVGPFEERDSISLLERNYITGNPTIIHTGMITNVTPYYPIMDMFVLPSFREGFPTVVLEASSMELPIITTRSTGCINSIVENETGIFTSITAEDLANKIGFYLDNEEIRVKHGANGRKFVVANFDQKIVWRAIEEQVFELS